MRKLKKEGAAPIISKTDLTGNTGDGSFAVSESWLEKIQQILIHAAASNEFSEKRATNDTGRAYFAEWVNACEKAEESIDAIMDRKT